VALKGVAARLGYTPHTSLCSLTTPVRDGIVAEGLPTLIRTGLEALPAIKVVSLASDRFAAMRMSEVFSLITSRAIDDRVLFLVHCGARRAHIV